MLSFSPVSLFAFPLLTQILKEIANGTSRERQKRSLAKGKRNFSIEIHQEAIWGLLENCCVMLVAKSII
jgi:hypothetical protein